MGTKTTTLAMAVAFWGLLGAVPFRIQGATLRVTSTADSGAGSLRAALASANNGDTIDATGLAGTITLTSGQLVIEDSVVIFGPGAAVLTVSGNSAFRVFEVTGTEVTIHDLRIANGASADSGGGMHVTGTPGNTTVLHGCIVADNSATANGGGIRNSGGATLDIRGCVISGNTAGSSGGGIHNDNSTLMISTSTLSDNTAGESGGAILNDGRMSTGILQIDRCTLSGNVAAYAGAIYNAARSNAAAIIESSTFSGNSAGGTGAVYNDGAWGGFAQLSFNACTFSGNYSGGGGGTIRNDGRFGGRAELGIGNTILNLGHSNVTIENDAGTAMTLGHNLSSDGAGGVLTHATDRLHTDPLLGPLQDNGGPTLTHALLPGSLAIDAGSRHAYGYPIDLDQRGLPRTHDAPDIGNAAGGDGCDVGAVEFIPPLTVQKQKLKLNFAKPDADCFSLTALLDPGGGFAPAGQALALDLGGATVMLNLDEKGRAATAPGVVPAGKVKLSARKGTSQWTLTVSFKQGSWQGPWAAWGLVNADVPKPGQVVTVLAVVQLGSQHFAEWLPMTYTAKAGKSGATK